ncbi:sodium-coupled monocarboxylate transporter 2-like [Photinus pyralis]|uniref:sodium-coupled monocarboxylate transporter 2-like n=1 Tax=Photinus pyralis TaxID=7054 RepID=UPI0012670180|nr:sodium-coupled monocarboxylate transporter 2-like [Photinus pyralis]
MEYATFSIADYSLLAILLIVNCCIGLYFGFYKKQKTLDGYLFGGRKMATLPITLSLVTGTVSPIAIVGVPSEIYTYGTQVWLMIVSILIAGLINHFVYLPVFYNLQLQSVYHYFEMRFDKSIKNVASLIYILTKLLMMPIIIYASSLSLNQVTGINLHVIAWVIAGVCIFYTTIGGIEAVAWTDSLQVLISFGTILYVLAKGISLVGGVDEVWTKSSDGQRIEFFNMNPDPTVRNTFLSVVIGNIFLWLGFLAIPPAGVQRSISLPSLQRAKRANMVTTILAGLSKLLCCFLGLVVYAKYANCDPFSIGLIKKLDQIFPYFVTDIGKSVPGLSGLFVAGLCTTTLGVLSTFFNSISAICYLDFFIHILPKGGKWANSSTVLKVITAIVGIISVSLVFVAEKLGSLFELLHCVHGITEGPLLGAFTLGLLIPRSNARGALIGVLSSVGIMSYLIIQHQIYVWDGAISYPPKPLRTTDCNATYLNQSLVTTITPISEAPLWLFRLSFQYYTGIGTALTILIGVLISVLTTKDSEVDPALVIPCVRRFCSPKSQAEFELKNNLLNENVQITDNASGT